MNPIGAAGGAIGAAIRSVMGYFRNRGQAKDLKLPTPKFRLGRVLESMVEGAIVGMFLPGLVSAAVVGYAGSDAAGKVLRTVPGVKRIMPSKE